MYPGSRIIYNGLTMGTLTVTAGGQPGYGYTVDEVDVSDIDVDSWTDRRALQDGLDAADIYLGGRQISMIVSVFGSTRGHTYDQLAALIRAFSPRLAYNAHTAGLGFLQFFYFRPTDDISTWPTSTYPDGIPLQMFCRPTQTPRYNIIRENVQGSALGGFSVRASVSLLAIDPRQYFVSPAILTIGTSPATYSTYKGDYPNWPIVTFTMSSAGTSDMTINIAGGSVRIDASSITSNLYSINYKDRTIKNNSGVLFQHLLRTDFTQVFKEVSQGFVYSVSSLQGISGQMSLAFYHTFA